MPDADLDDAYDDPVNDDIDPDEVCDQPDEWRDFNDE